MSNTVAPAEAEVFSAVDTLMKQLEHEQSWIEELRTTLQHSETRASRLMTSVEAAIQTLSIPQKREIHFRLRRMRADGIRKGRPPKDGRARAMLHFIAERAEGTITSAELRLHLKERGLPGGNPQYVSNRLKVWCEEGLLVRESHGTYRIDAQNASLRAIRFRKDREAVVREVRAELRGVQKEIEDGSKPFKRPISDWVE